jgi:hypothetical protein
MTTTTAQPSQTSRTTRSGEPGDASLSHPLAAQPGAKPGREQPRERRRRATNPSSAMALAMLTRQPVFATSVPRLHVGRTGADGSILVDDRASDQRFLIYTPRLNSQFRAGYRAGLWYVRIPGDPEPSPRSPGFPTAVAAVETLGSPQGLRLRKAAG